MDGAAAFLSTLQLADSFFPTGGFAHSHGLESMVGQGAVTTALQLEELLQNQITWSILPSDGVALLNAHRAASGRDLTLLIAIDQLLYASKLPLEIRQASTQVGRRTLSETAAWIQNPLHQAYRDKVQSGKAPGNGAVVFGLVTGLEGVSEMQGLLAFVHSYSVSVLGAAMRLLPISHTDCQGILHRLSHTINGMLSELQTRDWRDMSSFTPALDLASMHHEAADLRLFAS